MNYIAKLLCHSFAHDYQTMKVEGLVSTNVCKRCGETMIYRSMLKPHIFGSSLEKNK
jgi:hypothetical protein